MSGPCTQGGIIYSNSVTTVSPTYAKEALDGGAGGWLRATLAKPEVRGKFKVGAPPLSQGNHAAAARPGMFPASCPAPAAAIFCAQPVCLEKHVPCNHLTDG